MPSSRKKPETQGGLSGTALKYIAMTAMLADHIGVVLLERIVYYRGSLERVAMIMTSQWGDRLYWLCQVLRSAGRIAFPIYCFLLVEGFLHTRDWRRYWLRMAAFALISEIPFRLAVWNTWAGGGCNVYVELAIGLLVLRGLKQSQGLTEPYRVIGMAAAIGGGCLAAVFLKADYDMDGILIISLFYLLRDKRPVQVMSGSLLSFLGSWDKYHGTGVLSAVPLLFYNGRKGQARWKYAFYWFYPLHLMALFFIRLCVIGIPLG